METKILLSLGDIAFFATEYTIDHLLLPESARDRIQPNCYSAGRIMYLHEEDLAKLKSNVGGFTGSAGTP